MREDRILCLLKKYGRILCDQEEFIFIFLGKEEKLVCKSVAWFRYDVEIWWYKRQGEC